MTALAGAGRSACVTTPDTPNRRLGSARERAAHLSAMTKTVLSPSRLKAEAVLAAHHAAARLYERPSPEAQLQRRLMGEAHDLVAGWLGLS